MNDANTVVHLLSGGIDSVVLLYDLVNRGSKVHCALFNYRQRHVQELGWARHHCHMLNLLYTTFDLPQLRGSELTDGDGGFVVPFRNPIMISHAVNLAASIQADTVTIACNSDDQEQFQDCRPETINAINAAIKLSGIKVNVVAPYIDKPKAWIVALGNDLGVKFWQTWSCYQGGQKPCGKCPSCLKRSEVL